jgi:hypothetical protein
MTRMQQCRTMRAEIENRRCRGVPPPSSASAPYRAIIYCLLLALIRGNLSSAVLAGIPNFPQRLAAAAGGRMTDRSHETLSDADFRNLARLVSACTLGLWAFAVGLLIGTFLFS